MCWLSNATRFLICVSFLTSQHQVTTCLVLASLNLTPEFMTRISVSQRRHGNKVTVQGAILQASWVLSRHGLSVLVTECGKSSPKSDVIKWHRVHVSLGVTCHLHFWRHDQDRLHCLAWLCNKDSGWWRSASAAGRLVTDKAYVRQADSSTAGEGLVGP